MTAAEQKIDVKILDRGRNSAEVSFTDTNKRFSKDSFAGSYFSHWPDFIVPINTVPHLVRYVLEKYGNWNILIDQTLREYAAKEIDRERKVLELANAKDCPEIEDGLLHKYRPIQRAAIQFHEFQNYSKINSLVTGSGKTVVAIGMAEREQYRTLVILPAKAINTWKAAITKFTGKSAVELSGRVPELRMLEVMMDQRNQYFLISYEIIGSEHFEDKTNELETAKLPWIIALNLMISQGYLQFFVADECHQFCNLDTQRAKALLSLNIPTGRALPMSATLVVNNGKDLYPILRFCDRDSFPSPKGFLDAYYTDNGKVVKDDVKLQKLLSVYMFRRDFDDLFGENKPEVIRETRMVEITGTHQKRIESLNNNILLSSNLEDKKLLTTILPKLNAYRVVVGEAKIAATIELAREAMLDGKKVIVFAWFNNTVELAAKELGCKFIHGGTPMGLRTQHEDEFQNDESIRCIVLSVKTSQEVLTLTAATYLICNDVCWTEKDHTQMEGRAFLRTNDPHGGTSVVMISDTFIDNLMLEIRKYKQELAETSIDGTKAYAQSNVHVIRELIGKMRQMAR